MICKKLSIMHITLYDLFKDFQVDKGDKNQNKNQGI